MLNLIFLDNQCWIFCGFQMIKISAFEELQFLRILFFVCSI
jgi:hypothetical protein